MATKAKMGDSYLQYVFPSLYLYRFKPGNENVDVE